MMYIYEFENQLIRNRKYSCNLYPIVQIGIRDKFINYEILNSGFEKKGIILANSFNILISFSMLVQNKNTYPNNLFENYHHYLCF